MVQTYEEALTWIHSRLRLGIKPGLKRMEAMMGKLQHPERKVKAIHIAGTNGKGSTVCYLRNILEEAGYTVGTFTSPYFEMFNERISVNGIPIQNDELIQLVNVIQPLSDELEQTELGAPSEFEVITAMAFYYFGHHSTVDIVLFETGLGGRLDSTNIVQPLLSLITNIGYDHMNFLGDTLEEIAYEKAGIIKPNTPVITSAEQPAAIDVIRKRANDLHSTLFVADQDYHVTNQESSESGEIFSTKGLYGTFENLEITMKGAHQVKNAALGTHAIAYLNEQDQLTVSEHALRAGLKKAKWIGRFEQIASNPTIILDGAHNPEGVVSLLATIDSHLKDKKVHIIFSALKDKKLDEMIEPLANIAESITFTSFDFPRVCSAKELYDKSTSTTPKHYQEDWKIALRQKIQELSVDEVLIVTGSLYFLSEVRPFIMKKV